jgi:hypothetical protein
MTYHLKENVITEFYINISIDRSEDFEQELELQSLKGQVN